MPPFKSVAPVIRNNWLILIALLLYVVSTLQGNRYTFDGRIYITVAKNIASGKGIINQVGTELWQWPPLYPFVLSAGYLLGNIDVYILILHLLLLLATLAVWFRIIDEELAVPRSRTVAKLYLVFSAAILFCYVYVLSESVFLFTSALYFYYITKWLRRPSPGYLWYAAVAGLVTLITRNAGIFLFTGGFLYVIFYLWKKGTAKRLIPFALHILIVLSGFAVWNIQKLWIGDRMHIISELLPRLDVWANWQLISKNIAAAFIPFALPQMFHAVFMSGLMAFFLFSVLRLQTNSRIALFMSSMTFYLFFWLIVPGNKWNMERFMAPAFPLLFVSLFYFAGQLKFRALQRHEKWAIFLLMVYPAVRIIKNALFWGGLW